MQKYEQSWRYHPREMVATKVLYRMAEMIPQTSGLEQLDVREIYLPSVGRGGPQNQLRILRMELLRPLNCGEWGAAAAGPAEISNAHIAQALQMLLNHDSSAELVRRFPNVLGDNFLQEFDDRFSQFVEDKKDLQKNHMKFFLMMSLVMGGWVSSRNA